MRDRDETDLVRALRGAAGGAPEPAGDMLTAIGDRRRRRSHRRARSMLAAAAVLVVIGGGTAVARDVLPSGGGEGVSVTGVAADPSSPAADPSEGTGKTPEMSVDPVAEVWPKAVSTIPAKAADGWKYRPITGLSATELLLTAESSFEKAGRLEVYDTAARKSTVLAEMPAPPGVKGYFAQDVEVGADSIVWWGKTPNNRDEWADFWVVPRTGGTARRVGEVTGARARVERIGVTADSVFWSVRAGGVYRMPLAGGSPEYVAGTDGLHLLYWPWAFDVANGREGEDWDRNQTKLFNLETGQTVAVNAPDGARGLRCGPVWCFGASGDESIVQRTDGSDRRALPGLSGRMEYTPLAGRFGFFSLSGVTGRDAAGEEIEDAHAPLAAVYDPITGRTAGVGKRDPSGGGGIGTGTSSSPTSIIYWDEDRRQVEECKVEDASSAPRSAPSGAPLPTGKVTVCSTTEKGGGKEFTVVNLLAVSPTE
ncbi:hypothetical protein [Streptosporangium pseudovulgare]|uniref:WD40 repeat domain-containing protein n=1 Tax=Streptosporangium pseudovulgare TaxID=35765 RepID=A0ABQ2RHS2_9ACTN|nr:hypothetical protein [Streptosporangium pseudovulgare]GGQ27391.1 hypothetical protein GCM10010140_66980 [Streptosporangium pseudovulgare]